MTTTNGWDKWAQHVLRELERMASAIENWRNDNATIHSELAEIKALLGGVGTDADTALTKSQVNEIELKGLTVKTGLIATLISLVGTGLGALFIYAASQFGQ